MIQQFLAEYFLLIDKYNLVFDISDNGELVIKEMSDKQIDDYIDGIQMQTLVDVYDDEN